MGAQINDGGPVFPIPVEDGLNYHGGMTLREWFAGQALAGILANSNRDGSTKEYAHDAYEQADAMLAARNEVKP